MEVRVLSGGALRLLNASGFLIGSRDVGVRSVLGGSAGSLVLLVAVRTAVRWPCDLAGKSALRG
jgi:hypothetical protein